MSYDDAPAVRCETLRPIRDYLPSSMKILNPLRSSDHRSIMLLLLPVVGAVLHPAFSLLIPRRRIGPN